MMVVMGFFVLAGFSSCFTTATLDLSLKKHYIKQSPIAIQSAGIDAGTFYLNFTRSIRNKKQGTHCHIIVPIDSVYRQFIRSGKRIWKTDTAMRKRYEVHKVYPAFEGSKEQLLYGNGIVLEMDTRAIKKGFHPKTITDSQQLKVLIPSDTSLFKYEPIDLQVRTMDEKLGKQNYVFICYLPHSQPDMPIKYFALSIEFSKKRHPERLVLLPVAFVLDVVTSPIQLLLLSNQEKREKRESGNCP
jgi:hypothetical protein